ncbi:MAG: FlgD immunoglobulin-like domain containing protein, partial [Clostridia bacterium]|nr:FlgD immunoglobulin-like domain containing protein [Clostridia bacterium]
GESETPVGAAQLFELVSGIQGEKLLILDACFSGALIGRGLPVKQPPESGASVFTPFLSDPSIHVLTSASGNESSWYFDSEKLSTGALSYFASAFSTGLGLYGSPEADQNGDGEVTLEELYRYLSVAVPSSSSQLLSAHAEGVVLPTTKDAVLSRPLTGFSYGSSLLRADDATLEFSFTAAETTAVQYRLVDYADGRWNWAEAQTFLDEGDGEGGLLEPGRKTRSLTLPGIAETDSGYLMLQVFSVSEGELILCSERLIAVQGAESDASLSVTSRGTLQSGKGELPIRVNLTVPAELTVSIFDSEGRLVRRLAASQLTRPSADGATHLYWDGRNAQGDAVPIGQYTVAAEAIVGLSRRKATCEIHVTDGAGLDS